MIRRTRSYTAPGSTSAPSKPCTKSSASRRNGVRNNKSRSASLQDKHSIRTPTFTWDIPKWDKQIIYNDLGVKEMRNEGAEDGSHVKVNKKAKITKKPSQNKGSGHDVDVKGHLISPCQFKPSQEHISNGHACSCKKQLLLEEPNDPFYSLSDEIMLGIFRWLPLTSLARSARVCKRWHHLVFVIHIKLMTKLEICNVKLDSTRQHCKLVNRAKTILRFDDTLWRRIDLSSKTFGPGTLGQVLKRGTVAAKLSRCSIQDPVFDEVTPKSPVKATRRTSRTSAQLKTGSADPSAKPVLHLQYIDLSASEVKPEELGEILDRCPGNQIKKLSLESCTVNDDIMKCVANHGGTLEELNLCMCSGLKEAGLRRVLESCTKLKCLNIGWTSLTRKEVNTFVECAPRSLEKLNLSGCRQTLRNEDVILLARDRCSAMKELDLSDATAIGFSAVDAIVDHMTELQHIALSRCYSIPRLSFVQLSTLKKLRALDIFGLVQEAGMLESMQELIPGVQINIYPFSAIARPTTTKKRSNIWEVVCHE